MTPTLALAEALESELALLSAELEAATHRQLTLIRELEPTRLWASHGATSYTAWLGWRIGLAPAAAREKVRVSRALAQLPANRCGVREGATQLLEGARADAGRGPEQ